MFARRRGLNCAISCTCQARHPYVAALYPMRPGTTWDARRYQSLHYIIRIPKHWLKVSTFADLGELKAEIQLRTLAQHIWAATSHKLQYKHEDSVPPPIRRSIYRVSALLETVDLEFERVLAERGTYIEESAKGTVQDEPLRDGRYADLRNMAWFVRNARSVDCDQSEAVAKLCLAVRLLFEFGEPIESVVPSLVDLFLRP